MTRSIGISSHDAKRAMLSASGFPVPFSIRDKVEAETPVRSATSRRLKPCCSRRRRTAPPSSDVLTPDFFGMLPSLPLIEFYLKYFVLSSQQKEGRKVLSSEFKL